MAPYSAMGVRAHIVSNEGELPLNFGYFSDTSKLPEQTHLEGILLLLFVFSVLAYGILGKGGLFMVPPLDDCLIRITGSSTRAGTGCRDLQLIHNSVVHCQALT